MLRAIQDYQEVSPPVAAIVHQADTPMKLQALVVDDVAQVRRFVADILREAGWEVDEARTAEQAFEMSRSERWSLVFCDVQMEGANGFAVLRRFAAEQPQARFILMTGYGSAVGALDATSCGAYDYLQKPFGSVDVQTLADAVREQVISRAAQPLAQFADENSGAYSSDIDLVGNSPAFVELMKLVGRVAQTALPVLVTGESGTGKEIVARAIHRRSARAAKPFVTVNCGAIPSELIESELFGHVRGSFTGAERDRTGLLEEADGGTIFLDEITETTIAFQAKLLRALQEGELRRVGSNRTSHVDVRVIAATNRDIETEVRTGRFRQDLLYRLNAVTLWLPPLRERRADIPALIQRFIKRLKRPDDTPLTFSPEAIRLLDTYQWPGNVRELENAVLRAATLCDHIVYPKDLPEHINRHSAPSVETVAQVEAAQSCGDEQWLPLAQVEGRYVARVLEHTGGNKQAASRLLEVDRKTLGRMIERHGIELKK